jgi:Peroxidase
MLRLVFHDAATFDSAAGDGGADASVQFELDRAENFGLKRGWRVIETAQKVFIRLPLPDLAFLDAQPVRLYTQPMHACAGCIGIDCKAMVGDLRHWRRAL